MIYHQLKWFGMTALLATVAVGCNSTLSSEMPHADSEEIGSKFVAITQIVEHPSLNAVRDGVQDELAKAGYEAEKTLKWEWESAQGSPEIAAQIADKFVGEQPDLIVAISTPSAQAIASAADNLPILFSAVTDPVGARLVGDLDHPGGFITGVSDLSPIPQHLDLIAEIVPDAKQIGVLYNGGEANSVSLINLLKQAAPERDMTIVEATVSSTGEVATATQSLVGKVDVIYLPTDNTTASAAESIIQLGQNNRLPVFAGDTGTVERGAIATLSFNYYDIGRQTGRMALRVFEGEKPGDIPVELGDKLELVLNPSAAEAMGVTIPESVVARADEVIE